MKSDFDYLANPEFASPLEMAAHYHGIIVGLQKARAFFDLKEANKEFDAYLDDYERLANNVSKHARNVRNASIGRGSNDRH